MKSPHQHQQQDQQPRRPARCQFEPAPSTGSTAFSARLANRPAPPVASRGSRSPSPAFSLDEGSSSKRPPHRPGPNRLGGRCPGPVVPARLLLVGALRLPMPMPLCDLLCEASMKQEREARCKRRAAARTSSPHSPHNRPRQPQPRPLIPPAHVAPTPRLDDKPLPVILRTQYPYSTTDQDGSAS